MALKGFVLLCYLALVQAGVIGTHYGPVTPVASIYPSINVPVVTKTITPVVTKTVTPVFAKTLITPGAPVYETILTTHESKHKSSDGSQHTSFSKTLDTAYSKIDQFDSHAFPKIFTVPSLHPDPSYGKTTPLSKRVIPLVTKTVSPSVVYPGPILTNTFYQPHYSVTPLEKSFLPVVTKTINPPVVGTSPILTKTVTPILKKTEIVSPVLTSHDTPVLKTISPVVTKTVNPVVYNPTVVTKTITAPVLKKTLLSPAIVTAPVKTAITYSDAPLVSHMSFTGLGANYAW